MKCEYIYDECRRKSMFGMMLHVDDTSRKRWVMLCPVHDRELGRKRLLAMGWGRDDAIKWERKPSLTPKKISSGMARTKRHNIINQVMFGRHYT
mgnify:CR=1 FL=1